MIYNFATILSTIVKSRIEKDYSVLQRFIPFALNPVHFIFLKNFIFILFSILTSYFYIVQKRDVFIDYLNIIILILLSIMILYSFISGSMCYRRTHFPVHYELLILTPLNDKLIYLLLILEELILFIINGLPFYFFLFFLFFIGVGTNFFLSLFFIILLILSSIIFFILGNRLFGEYQIYKIDNKIGLIRFFIYLFSSTLTFLVGFIITKLISTLIKTVRPEFKDIHLLLNESYILNKFDESKNIITTYLSGLNLEVYIKFALLNYYFYIVIFSLIIVIIIFLNPPKFNNNVYLLRKVIDKDMLGLYIYALKGLSKILKLDGNVVLNKDLTTMLHKRWLLSPQIFPALVYCTENFFYLGIVTALSTVMSDSSMFFSVLIVFSLMSILVHSYTLYDEYPQVFSLSSEQKNILLLKSSPIGIDTLFLAKYYLLSLVLFLPTFITMKMGFVLLLVFGGIDYIFLFLICIVIFYLIAPIIQLYMTPYISKFNLDHTQEIGNTKSEQDMHEHFQGIPRMFILVPVLLFTFTNAIIPFYENIKNIHFLYLALILIPILVFFVISINIIRKGLKYLHDKII